MDKIVGMSETRGVKVWDPLLRLCHWTMALGFAVAYVVEDYDLHRSAGYAVLASVALRILWGFAGAHHARFRSFVTGPVAALRYLRDLLMRRADRHLGHNPAGAAMTLALLVAVLVASVSGVALDAAENRAGPLAGLDLFLHADRVALVHESASTVCIVLVCAHLVGVTASSLQHRENLLMAMINGRKRGLDG